VVSLFPVNPFIFDHVRSLLGDHYNRRVGVTANQRGHDGRVNHPKPVDPVHLKPRVHHRSLVPLGPHLSGAHRMVYGHRVVPDHAFPVGIRVPCHGGATGERYVMQLAIVSLERRGLRHGHHKLDALHQRIHVLLGCQVIGKDTGIHERVGAP